MTAWKVLSGDRLPTLLLQLRRPGTVLASGVWDLLHAGHVTHLEACRALGSALVVSVGNDETARQLKGEGRPARPAAERARMVAALACVDWVFIAPALGTFDYLGAAEVLRPTIHAVTDDDRFIEQKRAHGEAAGWRVVVLPRTPPREAPGGISTTAVVAEIKQCKGSTFPFA